MHDEPQSRLGQISDSIEEAIIASCLGLMTIITFANVIARYVFNSNILWALELTVFLFAWLILIGASYAVKKHVHIGIDVIINMVSEPTRKIMALISVAACIAFAVMLLIGSWNYWYPFATERIWMETNDIPMPEMFQFIAIAINEGEKYEKIPLFIPYFALPLGMALLTFRFIQLGWRIATGQLDRLIASHEAEDALEEIMHAHEHEEEKEKEENK